MHQVKTPPLPCSSTLPPSLHHRRPLFPPLLPRLPSPSLLTTLPLPRLPSKSIQYYSHAMAPLGTTPTQEIVETASGFVEVGYVSNAHGLQGEICIKPNTDFPELRFAKPGRRWLKQLVTGKESIREVELVEGRGHPGQKSWILRFEGINSIDEAKQLVGSTLLVREEDRPELDDGEFYTRDLVGMRVILKDTGDHVGTVVNVFNTGASDLLHVMLCSLANGPDKTETPRLAAANVSGPLVWIPFVEAIVPDVNMGKREMLITPPKGLLELNLHNHERSKKERRQLEWKERKKFQRQLIAAKKKLYELEQKHVFHGLRYGEKSQRSLLTEQIVRVNSKLLQLALESIEVPSKRLSVTEFLSAARSNQAQRFLKISKECVNSCASEEFLGANANFLQKGLHLLSKGKMAVVLVMGDIGKTEGIHGSDPAENKSNDISPFSFLQNILSHDWMFIKMEDRTSIPLILVSQEQGIQSLKTLFLENDYFGFDFSKVWFLEETKLPVVTNSLEEQLRYKILMKTPWEMLQTPVGSGEVITSLVSESIIDNLCEIGVEYIEICSPNQIHCGCNVLLLGFLNSQNGEVGIQLSEYTKDLEETYDAIISMNFAKLLSNQLDKLQFSAVPKQHSHVELVEKVWIDVVPTSPNSYELNCSIYSYVNACPLDKICVIEVTE